MTKDEIIKALDDSRQGFMAAIAGLTDEQLQQPGVNGGWTVKDIMYHLTLWEAELVTLLWQAAAGQTPTTVHFNQSHFDQTNASWYEQGKDRPLDTVRSELAAVRTQLKRRLDDFSEAELNDPQHFPWQRDYRLWEWIGSDTFLHEPEHTTQVVTWRKSRGD